MTGLVDEFRRGWRGAAQPSVLLSASFAIACLMLATLVRWGMAHLRPDVFFTPYYPAVFFATAFGGLRIGAATMLAGGALGLLISFAGSTAAGARIVLLGIYLIACALAIWGLSHY